MAFSNSPLVTYTRLTKNKTSPRNHAIDTITIHCVVGQVTAKQCCDYFATTDVAASSNYVVGKDGSIGLAVEEKDRSWCSSNSANDHRAVTIEVASDTTHPYAVTDKAFAALIELVADICKRNGIKQLLWKGDKSLVGQVDKQNMTVHRWFASRECPGEYLYSRHGEIAAEVNKRLGISETKECTHRVERDVCSKEEAEALVDELNAKGFSGFKVVAMDETTAPSEDRVTCKYLIKAPAGTVIYTGAGANTAVAGKIALGGIYTIVEEANGTGAKRWGKLKSGAGWISLDNTTKL